MSLKKIFDDSVLGDDDKVSLTDLMVFCGSLLWLILFVPVTYFVFVESASWQSYLVFCSVILFFVALKYGKISAIFRAASRSSHPLIKAAGDAGSGLIGTEEE